MTGQYTSCWHLVTSEKDKRCLRRSHRVSQSPNRTKWLDSESSQCLVRSDDTAERKVERTMRRWRCLWPIRAGILYIVPFMHILKCFIKKPVVISIRLDVSIVICRLHFVLWRPVWLEKCSVLSPGLCNLHNELQCTGGVRRNSCTYQRANNGGLLNLNDLPFKWLHSWIKNWLLSRENHSPGWVGNQIMDHLTVEFDHRMRVWGWRWRSPDRGHGKL